MDIVSHGVRLSVDPFFRASTVLFVWVPVSACLSVFSVYEPIRFIGPLRTSDPSILTSTVHVVGHIVCLLMFLCLYIHIHPAQRSVVDRA